MLDDATAHAACEAKDRRYDGLFFVGVKSTGIYCRCVCSARTPKRENRTFHPSAAAAEKAGFRPCLLCRPECAPGQSRVDAIERLAHAAVQRIEAGALEEAGLETLAAQLGVTDRHLRRVVLRTFGATPVELAQTHRLLTAKRLLRDTDLSMADVAFAAGFQSVRRFNTLFRERYALTPSRVRARGQRAEAEPLTFSLATRGGFEGRAVFEHFALRQVVGVEASPGPWRWRRSLRVGAHVGEVTLDLGGSSPTLTLSEALMPAFRQTIARVRGALDLDADVEVINRHLSPDFAADVKRERWVRLPGHLDAFELSVRAVLGQQVTVKAATTLTSRLVAACGGAHFPTPEQVVELGVSRLAALGQPRQRAETLHRLARALADGKLTLVRGAIAAGRAGLAELPGIGPWTLEYVALRGLGDPDAFPLGDSALRAAFPGDLKRASEAWRPWRAYAAARLWRRHAMKTQ